MITTSTGILMANNLDSSITISSAPKSDANNSTPKVKKRKWYSSTWVQPLLILAGIVAFVIAVIFIRLSMQDDELIFADGGDVNTVRVNRNITGRDELNIEQAKYISQQQLMEAEKKAAEGITSDAVIQRAEVSAGDTTYLDTDQTNLDAVTRKYKGMPMTIAQLDELNEQYNNNLFSKGVDDNGAVYYSDRKTGEIIRPIDSTTGAGSTINYANNTNNPNASYAYSNNQYNSGQSNGNNGDGGAGGGNGGNNNAISTADSNNQNNQNNQNAQPVIDPAITAKRKMLREDYAEYREQRQSLQQQYDQLNQNQQQQYYDMQQRRSNRAANSLDNGLRDIQNTIGQSTGYRQKSYLRDANQQSNDAQSDNSQSMPVNNDQSSQPQTQGNGGDDSASSNTSSQQGFGFMQSSYGAGKILDQKLPKNIIRAGTRWQAIVTNSVNTDDGLQVTAQLLDGKFAGDTVYGLITSSRRNVGITFTTLAPQHPRKPLIPINAFATTIGTQKTGISADINRHYLRNYGVKSLTSVMRGIGDAYENSGETAIVTENGTVIRTKPEKPTSEKIKADVLGQLGDDLTSEVEKLGDRPVTYRIPMGSVINVVLASDMDVNNTTSSLSQYYNINNTGLTNK